MSSKTEQIQQTIAELKIMAEGNLIATKLLDVKIKEFEALTTSTKKTKTPYKIDLDFPPRNIELLYNDTVHKSIDLDSNILPVYEENIFIAYPLQGISVKLRITGSEYNDKEVNISSLDFIINKLEISSYGSGTTLQLKLSWKAGMQFLTNPDKIKDCDDLRLNAYPRLKTGIEEFYMQLYGLKQAGVAYFDAISYGYNTALDNFNKAALKQDAYTDQIASIEANVLSILSIGCLSWTAKLIKLTDIVEDMLGVTIDKSLGTLKNSDKVSKAQIEFDKLEEMLPLGTTTNNSFSLTMIGRNLMKLNNKAQVFFSDINELSRDVEDYCDSKTLKKHQEGYASLAKEIMLFLDKKTPVLKEYLPKFKVLNKEKLALEFERALWVRWLPLLKKTKKGGNGDSQMGGYSGRESNYPTSGNEDIDPDFNYETDICSEVVDRINALKITKMSKTWGGTGAVPQGQVATAIKIAEKEANILNLSL
jgi:hypothetical protein